MSSNISCKQAVNYISRKEELKLAPGQRFALYKHLSACSLCRHFSAQNKIITRAMNMHELQSLTAGEKQKMIRDIIDPGR